MNFGRTYLRILAAHNAIFDVIAFASRPAHWLASLSRQGSSSQSLIQHARLGGSHSDGSSCTEAELVNTGTPSRTHS